jgi:hypothetical protein
MFHLRTIAQRLLLPLLFVSGVATGLISCSGDDENAVIPKEEPNENEEANVEFTLNLGPASTRDVDYEDTLGNSLENYINPENLKIYMLDDGTSNAYAGSLLSSTPITIVSAKSAANNNSLYKVKAKVDESILNRITGNFRVMVCANWPGTVESNNIMTVVARDWACFNFPYNEQPYEPSVDNPIPMYGMVTLNKSRFKDSSNNLKKGPYDFGSITLVRALAKVIVKNVSDKKITSIHVTKCCQQGRCAPFYMFSYTKVPQMDYNAETKIDGDSATINVVGVVTDKNGQNKGLYDNIPFKKIEIDNKEAYMLYMPEYMNVACTSTWQKNLFSEITRIQLNFEDDTRNYYIDFKEDQDGDDYFSILRNHMYVFTVRYYTEEALNYYVENFDNFTAGKITFD